MGRRGVQGLVHGLIRRLALLWGEHFFPREPQPGDKGVESALGQVLHQVVGGVHQIDPPAQKVPEPLQGRRLHPVAGQLLKQGRQQVGRGLGAGVHAAAFLRLLLAVHGPLGLFGQEGELFRRFARLAGEQAQKHPAAQGLCEAVILHVVPQLVVGQQHGKGRRLVIGFPIAAQKIAFLQGVHHTPAVVQAQLGLLGGERQQGVEGAVIAQGEGGRPAVVVFQGPAQLAVGRLILVVFPHQKL